MLILFFICLLQIFNLITLRCQMTKENFFMHQKNLKKMIDQIQKDFDFDVKVIFTYLKGELWAEGLRIRKLV